MMPVVLALVLLGAEPPVDACKLCHPVERVEHETSVHKAEGVTCIACHGGDPRATEVSAAHAGSGFRGAPKRDALSALCASCHADVQRMRPYNLPTDQYALYQTSQHGQALARGNQQVAVCTDCHGVHGILSHRDPRSAVFYRNVPATCARCHDRSSHGRSGENGNPYRDYTQSVHGKLLLEHGGSAAPQCKSCHGAHGAAPPGVGDVDKVCGHCHATVRSYFTAGPHKVAMDEAGLPECASCHGHHAIRPATDELIGQVCTKCHEAGSAQVERQEAMNALFTSASEELKRAQKLVEVAASIPLYVEDYRARLEEAHTSLVEARPVMHSLDVAQIREHTQRARSIAEEVESEVNGKLSGRLWWRVGLALFWFYLLLTVAILIRFRRRALREAAR